jgi:aminopeptidase YwaD
VDLSASLHRIASADANIRREQLLMMLREINAPFTHYREKYNERWPENIIVSFGDPQAKRYVFGAHYDNVPGSTGANDNGAGVCILLALLSEISPPTLPVDFAFFDLEEAGLIGSQAYVQRVGAENILGMVNFDICGVGNTILAAPRQNSTETPLFDTVQSLQDDHPLQIVELLPPGDDLSFDRAGIPAITTCMLPEAEIDLLMDMARCIQLRIPPGALPSIAETMHNGARDSIDVVEESAMQTMLTFARDLLHRLQE